MKNKKKKWIIICWLLFILFLSAIFMKIFSPVCWAFLGNIFWPDKTYSITIFINGKKYISKVYHKEKGHLNNFSQAVPVLFLCNIPLGSKQKEHIKIFPNGLGVFQNSEQNFAVFPRYLLIQESALSTMPLEDDIKGWNTTYSISRQDGMFHYKIFSNSKHSPYEITFSIDEKILKEVPYFENAGIYKSQEKNRQINYTYEQWKRNSFQNHMK